MWWQVYDTLDLRGGKVAYILDDDEDMIEITYPNGMLIDVGKAEHTRLYYITVVASDDTAGWQHPLYEQPISDKAALPACLQRVIHQLHRDRVQARVPTEGA